MTSLYLSDILRRNGLEPKRVKLIRHSLKDKIFRKCYENGFMEEYQKVQKENFCNKCEYILTFISEPGTSAKFMGCYKVGQKERAIQELMPEGFPAESMFSGECFYFHLKKVDLLNDLIGRLIIDWGNGTRAWNQWADNEKPILAIQESSKFVFCGFENTVLNFDDLKKIIDDPILYENWHTALSSVYAIYLITDKTNGKLYVGSAYGSGGLLERWKCYVETKHGGNKKMMQLISEHPDRYHDFQFSILQILPKTITDDDVIAIESLFKRKFLSKEFGMNEN